jgi:serine/threonine protein kinase
MNRDFIYVCDKKYKFRLSDILGKGLTSIVYEGYKVNTDDKVAIKVIDKINNIKNLDKYITNEINILKTLNDYNGFIKLLDSYENKTTYYLIFEHAPIKFDTIVHIINYDKIFFYVKQLLEILTTLKSLRILHNDIKPANILVKDEQIKLCDFGMSKFLDEDNDSLSGTICGSPMYMDYDKFNGIKSCKTDFWSFKLIYYEMVYRKHLFTEIKNKQELKLKLKDVQENHVSKIKFYDESNMHTQLLKKLFSNIINTPEELLNEINKVNLNLNELKIIINETDKESKENELSNSKYFQSLINISKNSTQVFVEIESNYNTNVESNVESNIESNIEFNIDECNDNFILI